MEQVCEVSRISCALQQLSGMDRVECQLQNLRHKLDDLSVYAYQSAQVAADTAEHYAACEKHILNRYEDAAVQHRHTDGGLVDLTQIQKLLTW